MIAPFSNIDLSANTRDFLRLIEIVVPRGGGLFVPVEAYFDESGSHAGSKILCVAGYLFEQEAAKALTIEWNQWLEFYGVPYFRMSDCAHGNGPFKGWPVKRRIRLEKKLIGLINKYAWTGFASTLVPSEYADFPQSLYPMPGASPYSLCVQSCVANVALHWVPRTQYPGEVSYFFESGHSDQSEANRLMSVLIDDPQVRQAMRYASHAFVQKIKAPPVQAADILAWQWYTDRRHLLEGRPRRKDCEALLATNRVLTVHLNMDHFWDRLSNHPRIGPLFREFTKKAGLSN